MTTDFTDFTDYLSCSMNNFIRYYTDFKATRFAGVESRPGQMTEMDAIETGKASRTKSVQYVKKFVITIRFESVKSV